MLPETLDIQRLDCSAAQEFAACTIHNSLLEQSELLHKVFNFYDTRGAGFISREDIEEALHGANHEKERVELVLKQLDKRLQGKVSALSLRFCILYVVTHLFMHFVHNGTLQMTFEDFSLMLFECEDTGRSGFMLRCASDSNPVSAHPAPAHASTTGRACDLCAQMAREKRGGRTVRQQAIID